MSCDWGRVPLSSLGKIVTGKTPPSKVIDAFVNGSVPFVTPRDLDDRKWIKTTERYLSNTGLESVKGNIVPAHSVAVSCIGSDMGKARLLSVKSVTNQQINTILVNSELHNPEYIYYVLSTKQQSLKDIAGGSATPILNKSHFGQFEIDLPSKGYQNAVVDVLRGLDSKIEINTQTNQTLEQMAQAIFKSWFVDFDPVKAKMNGEQPEGMDAATASLFPDKLVESELGLIPEGWEVCLLNQKSEIKYGKNLPKTKLLDEGYPVFGGNGVIGYYSSYLYEDEQVLVSCRGAASGKVLRSLPKSFITNNSLVIDLSNSVLNINYVEPYLKGCNLEEYTSGSAQPQMTVANMAPVQILVPSEDILKSFDEVVKPLKSKIRANERQNLSLAALRDTLLPKLLSGEIELGETEEMAEVN
ncbi:restriction endonuclease subunit S [Vibrio vulnificus]|nr:restriction endonuclease subunit S [Vibrio vulnificus]